MTELTFFIVNPKALDDLTFQLTISVYIKRISIPKGQNVCISLPPGKSIGIAGSKYGEVFPEYLAFRHQMAFPDDDLNQIGRNKFRDL